MAQSGRSLSDSATTRSGRNDVTIKVTLLDGEDKTFSIDVSVKQDVHPVVLIVCCSEELPRKQ